MALCVERSYRPIVTESQSEIMQTPDEVSPVFETSQYRRKRIISPDMRVPFLLFVVTLCLHLPPFLIYGVARQIGALPSQIAWKAEDDKYAPWEHTNLGICLIFMLLFQVEIILITFLAIPTMLWVTKKFKLAALTALLFVLQCASFWLATVTLAWALNG